ncbi:dihydrolipoamide dehydrogenase [Verrucomicrobium sp. GAS474]|uniref:dihydrolipoyl dehydrogenase n=1 Tax=Verrucomicrobium sp. GAS474 TaxID=1882831 RepID=UPI00087DEF44|nr:dihydrolipoyl dehydrogenase [Verrucomicrobium sp. GAS474]SDU03887.1 dihydrolipoamide dehydrogenase [Verrucomicrobium sp. GAS474]
MPQYQVLVIGAGPGGYVAAIRAAQLGFKTAIVEKGKTLGGTCLNVGCIPSKALLASTEHYHFAQERFAAHGIVAEKLSVDLGAMMKRKDQIVTKLTGGVDFLMKKNKIEKLTGKATFLDANTVEIDNAGTKTTVTAEKFVLATGSVPVELPFLKFDGKTVLSSDHAIALTEVPKSLLVIGGGAIGLELGSVWRRLGAEVTVVEFLPRIATGFDGQVAETLRKSLIKQGITIHTGTKVESGEVTKGGIALTVSAEGKTTKLEAEKVLVAVGRRPYVEGLGLEKAGVALTDRGRVKIDAHWKTSVPHISAIGDIVDGPMLAHKASDEGIAAVERMAGKPGQVNFDAIPGVIYTNPEGASVGLTEEQLKEKGVAYKSGSAPFGPNGRALANDATEGFVKILADAKTDRVLGVHIVSSAASELIAQAVSVIEFGGSAEDIARTCHAHPTMSEVVREAAHAVGGHPIHG